MAPLKGLNISETGTRCIKVPLTNIIEHIIQHEETMCLMPYLHHKK